MWAFACWGVRTEGRMMRRDHMRSSRSGLVIEQSAEAKTKSLIRM